MVETKQARPAGDVAQLAGAPGDADGHLAPAPELNEDETVIGMDEQSCPQPVRLFEAWSATMGRLSAEAAKFAKAQVQQESSDGAPAAARQVAAEEFVRSSVAVDMIDIAKQMGKSRGGRAELERMAAAQAENEDPFVFEYLHQRSFRDESATRPRIAEMIQNRTTIFCSGQPSFSKWW